ncbi:MAG: hypothetical protein KAR45_17120, partial [Desulfobacteraceae bacterium]|nr:hypothetical protein [Desulfobacteraceae bacterium]
KLCPSRSKSSKHFQTKPKVKNKTQSFQHVKIIENSGFSHYGLKIPVSAVQFCFWVPLTLKVDATWFDIFQSIVLEKVPMLHLLYFFMILHVI